MLEDVRLHFADFDPKAPDLDLVVGTPVKVQEALARPAGEVARPVEDSGLAPRSAHRNEGLRSSLRIAEIAVADALATDPQLAHLSCGKLLAVAVDHHRNDIVERLPDRNVCVCVAFDPVPERPDRAFRWSIDVVQHCLRSEVLAPVADHPRLKDFAAKEDCLERRERVALAEEGGRELAEVRGDEMKVGHLEIPDAVRHGPGVAAGFFIEHADGSPGEQSPEDGKLSHVEAEGRSERRAIPPSQRGYSLKSPQAVVVPVVPLDRTLGLTGRARRVDDQVDLLRGDGARERCR